MKDYTIVKLGATLSLCAITVSAGAQAQQVNSHQAPLAAGTIFSPDSDRLFASDTGHRVHTNLRVLVPAGQPKKASASSGSGMQPFVPPVSGEFYETPQSLQCMYGVVATQTPGCNPNTVTALALRGSKAIAIVDAYHYSTAMSDLAAFSSQFNLPAPTSTSFQVVYATGSQPTNGKQTGWDLEAALDIEWAHAMAPKATIYLVEAASSSFSDIFQAVTVAANKVAAAGGGEVSMSLGSSEFSGETSYDSTMVKSGVVFFASSGDSPGTEYPCVSPNVVCVGGTTDNRNPTTGKWGGEMAWIESGGGLSSYEARPSYQASVAGLVGAKRGVPDIAAVADPLTGVWVYNSTYGDKPSWFVVGGTSVASPVMAGISNAAGAFRSSSAAELSTIYSTVGSTNAGWSDVTSGACGFYAGSIATSGWDFCTGVGTPRGISFKVAQ